MPELLVEIGVEELPASFIEPALAQLAGNLEGRLREARLGRPPVQRWATPRRLVARTSAVLPSQEARSIEVRGPAAKVAFDESGRPTKAAEGFARSQGVEVSALERRTTEQGEYVFAIRQDPGRPARDVIPAVVRDALAAVTFPKTMRWNDTVRFARPIRWLLVLLDGEVLPVEYAGVRADRLTFGHRFLAPGPFPVQAPSHIADVLERAYVVLDQDRRREIIESGLRREAEAVGGRPLLDPASLAESVYLVEYPTVFAGAFDHEFLALPRDVLITVMQHHQKFFAVEDAAGRLLPHFLAIRNGTEKGIETVREGNEWVLRSRLADARFFFDEDRRVRLADRVPSLAEVGFLEGLGSMLDKTQRLRVLAMWLGTAVGLDDAGLATLDRAAELCKADLITHMVGELPELQGAIGAEYARGDGEPEEVAAAIREHYQPRTAEDALPASTPGAVLAVADRLDSLTGALAIGKEPTGSEDPYGLRRAASAVVAIVLRHRVRVSLSEAVDQAQMGHALSVRARHRGLDLALDLLRARLRAAMLEAGVTRDAADAALAVGADDAVDAVARARAVEAVRAAPEFPRLATAFDRASRILAGQAVGHEAAPERFERPEELALYEAVARVAPAVDALAAQGRYQEALRATLPFADPIDRFFDNVFVMADDPEVQANRLALLGLVVATFRRVADLGKLAG